MIFLLLLGPKCEQELRSKGFLIMLFLTATIGGIWTVSVSTSNMIGSSAIIFAVLVRRVLPDPSGKQIQLEGYSASGAPSSFNNLPADIVVALLFIFGQSKLAIMEILGDAEEDGITQSGQIFAGVLGALSYWCIRKMHPEGQSNNAAYTQIGEGGGR
jgi:membrane associated rhomboid family serine protease